MKVKIIKSAKPGYWYASRIGETFEVDPQNDGLEYVLTGELPAGIYGLIGIEDCEILLPDRCFISDGSTASYYKLPQGCTELQHLISHKDMNAQVGEIFRACYRYGEVSHSDRLRDAKKIKFYAQAEIERLEK